jgi:hypothetical protein
MEGHTMIKVMAIVAFASFFTVITLVSLDVYGEHHAPPALSK